MAKEYIEREMALSALKYARERNQMEDIKSVPAADVVARDCYNRLLAENDRLRKERPARHGLWFLDGDYEYINCSECLYPFYMGFETSSEARQYLASDGKWRFCPNCGALMDKDGDGD